MSCEIQQLLLWNVQWLRSSPTCWSLSQRRFMPCLIQPCQRVTSKPWQPSVTWQTGNWWWSLAGQSTSQVNRGNYKGVSMNSKGSYYLSLCLSVLSSTRIFTYSDGWKLLSQKTACGGLSLVTNSNIAYGIGAKIDDGVCVCPEITQKALRWYDKSSWFYLALSGTAKMLGKQPLGWYGGLQWFCTASTWPTSVVFIDE